MSTNDYQQHLDLVHDLVVQIDELEKDKAVLMSQLRMASNEIAQLKKRVRSLEVGQIELFELPISQKELCRLDWQNHHQAYRRKTDTRPPKYH